MQRLYIVSLLPREVWLHHIIEYLHTLDLIFSLGRVSKMFRYQLVNEYLQLDLKKECLKDQLFENEINYIDNYSTGKIKYMIRNELLTFIVKYEQSMTKEGVFTKINTQSIENSQTNSIDNSTSTMNQKLNELLQSRMEIFNFYFSHFYRKQPTNSDTQLSDQNRKFLVVGDKKVGKTTLCKSFNNDFVFDKRHIATIGVEINSHSVTIGKDIETNFNLWDITLPEKMCGLIDGYYLNGSVCVMCFDLTNRFTYKNTPSWFRTIKRVEPECEIIIIGTKQDMKNDIKVKPTQINFPLKKCCPYLSISSYWSK